jgi:hypothetical protein
MCYMRTGIVLITEIEMWRIRYYMYSKNCMCCIKITVKNIIALIDLANTVFYTAKTVCVICEQA